METPKKRVKLNPPSGMKVWSVITHNYEVSESRIRTYATKGKAKEDFYSQILDVNQQIEEDDSGEEGELSSVEELFVHPYPNHPYDLATSKVKKYASDGEYWVILLVEHLIHE